jgi:hypothetical protein
MEIERGAAWHDRVHHQPMSETEIRNAQRLLAQNAAPGVHNRERRVIADGADIPEMIRKALELGHERSQIARPRRNFDVQCGLDRMSERQRISDRAVP